MGGVDATRLFLEQYPQTIRVTAQDGELVHAKIVGTFALLEHGGVRVAYTTNDLFRKLPEWEAITAPFCERELIRKDIVVDCVHVDATEQSHPLMDQLELLPNDPEYFSYISDTGEG